MTLSLDLNSEHAASETLKQLDDLTGVNIMTLREQWESKAQQHGIQIGIEKGIEKTAQNMIRRGYNENDIADLTGLEKSVIEELKKVASKKTQH